MNVDTWRKAGQYGASALSHLGRATKITAIFAPAFILGTTIGYNIGWGATVQRQGAGQYGTYVVGVTNDVSTTSCKAALAVSAVVAGLVLGAEGVAVLLLASAIGYFAGAGVIKDEEW